MVNSTLVSRRLPAVLTLPLPSTKRALSKVRTPGNMGQSRLPPMVTSIASFRLLDAVGDGVVFGA
jgi:hypothetical protein